VCARCIAELPILGVRSVVGTSGLLNDLAIWCANTHTPMREVMNVTRNSDGSLNVELTEAEARRQASA
jgi:hypothetical protein